MNSVKQVVKTIQDSYYFDAWKEILLDEHVVDDWKHILKDSNSDKLCHELGRRLYLNNIPYVIVTEYIDEFFRYCDSSYDNHKIKNKIAYK